MSSMQLLTLLQHHHPLNKIIPMINGFNYAHSSVVDYILKNYSLQESEYFILELCIHNCMFIKQVMQYLCFDLKKSNNIDTILKLIAVCPASVQFFKVGLYHSMTLDELKLYVDQIIQIESLSKYILEEIMTFTVELDHMWQQSEKDCSSSSDDDEINDPDVSMEEGFTQVMKSPITDKLNFLLSVLLNKMKQNPTDLWIHLFAKCILPTQSHAVNCLYVWYTSNTDHKDEFLGLLGNEWLNGANVLIKTRAIWYLCGFLIRVDLHSDFVKHAFTLMIDYLECKNKDLIWFATIQSAMYLYCFHYAVLPVDLTIRLISLMKNGGALALTSPLIVNQFCRIVEEEQLWFAKLTLKRQLRSVNEYERESVKMLWTWFPLDPVELPIFKSVELYYKSFQQ